MARIKFNSTIDDQNRFLRFGYHDDVCDEQSLKYKIKTDGYSLKIFKDQTKPTDIKYYLYYYDASGAGDKFINWVVVAIPRKGKVLPSYVIKHDKLKFSDIEVNYGPSYYDSINDFNNSGFDFTTGKIAICDLLGISNDSVNELMNSDNYNTYAIILNVDGREKEEYIFSGWCW